MSTRTPPSILRAVPAVMSAALLALSLGGCDPKPQADSPAQTPADAKPAEATPAPVPAPSDTTPPEESPAAPAQPAPDAPPPTDPSPTSKPTAAANEPALESMQSASAPAKLSVPVDLKYSFDTEPLAGQPVTLHLAAVPRIAVTNLAVSIKAADGIQVASGGPLSVQKASANGAYRQQFSITRQASAPELRVLITVDMPEGLGHGFFRIPFESGKSSQKQDSVKQR
jgi:hypothetical protein